MYRGFHPLEKSLPLLVVIALKKILSIVIQAVLSCTPPIIKQIFLQTDLFFLSMKNVVGANFSPVLPDPRHSTSLSQSLRQSLLFDA
jgi:hypothetical protein